MRITIASGALLVGALGIHQTTLAQTSSLLEEVVVEGRIERRAYTPADSTTALGLPAPIIDTPLSIQSVGDGLLRDQQARTLWDGLRNVSGVSSRGTNSGVNEDFVIRGFQLDPRRNYYRDGARFYNQFSVDPNNLERVEVLKGPASILYGALEPGGIINLVTPRLSAKPTADVRITAGSYDHYQASGAVSGPVSDDVFYRLYGSMLDSNSFRDYVEQDRWYLNPTLVWNLSDATTLRFNVEIQNDQQTADAGIVAILDRPANVPRETFYGEPSYKTETMDNISASVKLTHQYSPSLRQNSSVTYYDTTWDRQQVSVEATRGGVVGLPGGPGYPGNPNTLLPRSIYDNDLAFKELSTQHDLIFDFATGGISHTLQFGVQASRYEDDEVSGDRVFVPANANAQRIDIYNPSAYYGLQVPSTFSLFRDQQREETTYGAYLQDMVRLGEQWIVLAGVRYDNTSFDQHTLQSGTFRTLSREDSGFSPRAGVVFKALPTLSLYGSYTRSFSPKNGSKIINEPAVGTPVTLENVEPVDPEEATQLEVGAKWSSNDNGIVATLALYELTREDMVETNPRFTNYSVQVGEQRSRGVDLDVSLRLTSGLSVVGAYGYIDAEIIEDADRPAWEGNQLDNVPKHSGSVWLHYAHTSGFGGGVGAIYVDKRQGNLDNDFYLDSYTRVDLSLSYQLRSLRFDVGVKNLFDEHYYANSWRRDRIMPGAPRTFTGSVSYGW
ncbi:TonB-dependent siderophore receptor [Steroidobacter sp.]|uniref:TonB-dependent siderophore receptor n=1 Tax=Steroidobacter sp. TaxID=1978227 RepID=UPI001A3D9E43|nr:TonB-dependent siderophore receptor [Steroidobacter sp.]MBL8264971.1 TonB-dependent siderophore receptor [Steroidobacter sp.]